MTLVKQQKRIRISVQGLLDNAEHIKKSWQSSLNTKDSCLVVFKQDSSSFLPRNIVIDSSSSSLLHNTESLLPQTNRTTLSTLKKKMPHLSSPYNTSITRHHRRSLANQTLKDLTKLEAINKIQSSEFRMRLKSSEPTYVPTNIPEAIRSSAEMTFYSDEED